MQPFWRAPAVGQLLRYAALGLLTNGAGYLAYLGLTWAGLDPKLAMTLLYVGVAVASYAGNRTLTFSFRGGVLGSGVRFALAHLGGYCINLLLLALLVDRMGLPHQAVQAAAIFVVAGYLFVALKYFVFRR